MKRLITAAAVTFVTAGIAMAAETVTLPAKNGDVIFPHKKHEEVVKDCKTCHAKTPGKIEEMGKEWAHKSCKGCHEEKKAGPVKCSECHKK